MARYPDNRMTIGRGDSGRTRVTVTGIDPSTGTPMQMSTEFDQDKVRSMVRHLCNAAGLPEPWKKG